VKNIFPSISSPSPGDHEILGIPLSKVLPRLDALLMVTKSCAGRTCIEPWSVIHPTAQVHTLKNALAPQYDEFYLNEITSQVRFDKCELGFILESEGPQSLTVLENAADN